MVVEGFGCSQSLTCIRWRKRCCPVQIHNSTKTAMQGRHEQMGLVRSLNLRSPHLSPFKGDEEVRSASDPADESNDLMFNSEQD